MSAINNNNIYGGAIYEGHSLNGIMPFNQLIFHRNNQITINYIDVSTNHTLDTEHLDLEYNRDDDASIFNLPYIDSANMIDGYTDQYMQAQLPNPTVTLGIASIKTFNDRNVITYNLAPVKSTGVIYVNYVCNQQIVHQDKVTGAIGSANTAPLTAPQGYSFVNGPAYLSDLTFQYYPQYKNVLVNKESD